MRDRISGSSISGLGTAELSATPRLLIQPTVMPSGLAPTMSVNCDWPECSN
jgi:hypothetical protein